MKSRSLQAKFPEISKEWDYEKNGDLLPSNVTYGSHLDVYWKCPICNQSYKKKICNRTAPAKQKTESKKCPVCLGRQIVPGYNSLMAQFSSIVAEEWDYEKNVLDPDTIAPKSNKKCWWKCNKGHSYQSTPNAKVTNNGGNCPYCSHQRLLIENSLAMVKPQLAEEWDYESNKPFSPEDVSAYSNESFGWICSKCGHKWLAKVNNRSNGRGCPECSKGAHSSFPEQVIYYFVKQVFPDAINSYLLKGYELDVFIPSLKIGIEYDGEFYHKNSLSKDVEKSLIMLDNGIHLIRIRESNCPELIVPGVEVYTFEYSSTYEKLVPILKHIIKELCKKSNVAFELQIDIDSVRNDILSSLYTIPYEKSFEYYRLKCAEEGKELKAIWDIERNESLKPHMVTPFSEKEVFWICVNNTSHKWKNTVKSVALGYGCQKCAKRYQYTTEEWIIAARSVHGDKYEYGNTVYVNTRTPVAIQCPRHGIFEQLPSEHLAGKGCKYCAKQAFHPIDSLSKLYPEIAKQWDYEKNAQTGITPEEIGINATQKFWWHCTNGKEHSFLATISKRVAGTKCAVCHGKQVSYDTSIEYLYPDLVKEWSEKNIYKPSEVTKGSEKKIWWRCKCLKHPDYQATPYSRIKLKTGCPLCARSIKKEDN